MGRELVVATNNAHKVRELARLFPGVRLRTPSDLGIAFEFEETGATYLDNALGKALHLHAQVGSPVLADDSGLEVPALGGEPGIRSSRYGSRPGGPKLTDAERCELLLARAQSLADRSCFFVCCMALVLEPSRFLTAQEVLRGQLTDAPRGSGGFGYDPLFLHEDLGRTFAEATAEEKNGLSHRGDAFRQLAQAVALRSL
jgi:XTP/dITP diphosphohydrolase